MRSVSRREMVTGLALGVLGLVGCGVESNEENFTTSPGSAPPDAPKTAEE